MAELEWAQFLLSEALARVSWPRRVPQGVRRHVTNVAVAVIAAPLLATVFE